MLVFYPILLSSNNSPHPIYYFFVSWSQFPNGDFHHNTTHFFTGSVLGRSKISINFSFKSSSEHVQTQHTKGEGMCMFLLKIAIYILSREVWELNICLFYDFNIEAADYKICKILIISVATYTLIFREMHSDIFEVHSDILKMKNNTKKQASQLKLDRNKNVWYKNKIKN